MNIQTVEATETGTATGEASLSHYVRQHLADLDALPTYRPIIGCVIPAYNEAETIEGVLRSLLKQTRLPDQIHVVVNNTTDDTFDLAAKFAGRRTAKKKRKGEQAKQTTEVFVHDIGENPDKKVGALNYGFAQIPGCRLPARRRRRHHAGARLRRAARGRDPVRLADRRHLRDLHHRRLRRPWRREALS